MTDIVRDEDDRRWSDKIGGLVADELAMANLLAEGQIERAAQIAAQQIYVCLVSGLRPSNSN